MWFCPQCGNRNEDEYRFCQECGREKPEINEPAPSNTAPAGNVTQAPAGPVKEKKVKRAGKSFKIPVWVFIAAAVAVFLVVLLSLGVFNSSEALLKKGNEALAKENYKSAYSYLSKYADKEGLSNKERYELLEDARIGLAEEAIEKEKWDEATDYLEKCTGWKVEKLLEECNVGLAGDAIDAGDWDEADKLLADCSSAEGKELKKQCDYHFAVEAMDKEDWETAAGLLTGLDYSDSEKLLEECESHLGPDKAFLEALSEGIIKYMAADKNTFSSRLSSVKEIQSRISEFEGMTFHDSNLGMLAAEIIENINTQVKSGEDAIGFKIYYRSYQKTVWKSMIDFCDYMNELNSNYGFLEGNNEFKAQFVDAKDTWSSQYDKIIAFDSDFSAYRSKYSMSGWAGSQQFIKYTNGTGIYFKSVTFFFDLFDKNDQYTRTSETTIEVPMNQQIRIYFDCDAYKERSWNWDWFINFD